MFLSIPFLAKSSPSGPVKPSLHKQEKTKLLPNDTLGSYFFDDFSGKLPGQWLGDITSFAPVDQRLKLTDQAVSTAFLFTATDQLPNTLWEAGIEVRGVLTATNYVRFYLASTGASPHESQQGYHLQIDGANQAHVYSLWRQNGRTRALVLRSRPIPNQGNTFRARVRVTCSVEGEWRIFTDEANSGTFETVSNPDGISMVKDVAYAAAGYAGYSVNFSPTRRADFQLDYFLIKPLNPALDSKTLSPIQAGDIIINEILSNPKPDGVDFVELYNHSDKIVDLQQLYIASVNSNGAAGSQRKVSERSIRMHPNEYKILTTSPSIVKQQYPDSDFSAFVETPALPNFNNETGGVVLYSNNLTIDSLFYTPEMQAPFLTTPKGISLERQHFSMPTNLPGNFRSAATAAGGATPGYQNSQSPVESMLSGFFLKSQTFSPDNDGFEDELEITYLLQQSGFMVNIDIYNANGYLVKKLQRNQSLATQGRITWDGLSDSGQRLPVGIYVAVIETYHPQGATKTYRLSFVLAARL